MDALRAIIQNQPNSRALVRYFARDLLAQPVDAVVAELRAIPLGELIPGNELNLSIEGAVLPPDETAQRLRDLLAATRAALPGRTLHLPAFSPSGDYLAYYRACRDHEVPFDVVDVHAYGDLGTLCQVVRDVGAIFPDARLDVTEWNFGAGRSVDLGAYLSTARDFLGRLPTNVDSVHWFIWQWLNPDSALPTTLDVQDTPLEAGLRALFTEGSAMADIALTCACATKLSPNFEPKRSETMGVVIHATRGKATSLDDEYRGSVSWLSTPRSEVSAHFCVGPTEVTRLVHDEDLAWHAQENNHTHLGIEICQPETQPDYTDFQYRATAEIVRGWARRYGFPTKRVLSQTQPGIIGHEDSEQGKRNGKSDPGPRFSWDRFLALVNDAPPEPPELDLDVGDAIRRYLSEHPEAGRPRQAAFADPFGNLMVWTTPTPQHPKGALLVWRKWLDDVRLLAWE
jgi:hypothetical protein